MTSFDEGDIISNSTQIIKYHKDFPDIKQLISLLKNFEVEYSDGGNSTVLVGKMKIIDFLSINIYEGCQKYVFHNILNDIDMFNIISSLIPFPDIDKEMRISRLYIGSKGSGTHVHNHSLAVNYLIDGRKIWFCFPETEKNTRILKNMRSSYGSIEIMTLDWLNSNYDYLKSNIDNFEIIVQESGDCIVVPHMYYHGVINLTNSFGITYSWY